MLFNENGNGVEVAKSRLIFCQIALCLAEPFHQSLKSIREPAGGQQSFI